MKVEDTHLVNYPGSSANNFQTSASYMVVCTLTRLNSNTYSMQLSARPAYMVSGGSEHNLTSYHKHSSPLLTLFENINQDSLGGNRYNHYKS